MTNGIDLTIDKSRQIARNGDVITYTLWIQNTKNKPCEVTGASLLLKLPTATGAASVTPIALAPDRTYVGGFPFTQIATQNHVVAVNPGVDTVIAEAGIAGTLHDVPANRSFATIDKSLATEITQPSLSITKAGSISSGQAPQNVTYTYVVTNTSATPVPMRALKVSDDLCSNPTYVSGDNGDGLLTNSEQFTFTCSTLHQAPGSYTNTATACAVSNVDDRDVCSPPARWTVTLTPPPVPVSQSAVLPANATQAPCVIASPTGLTVRAGEVTTVRVRVRNVDAGTEARITLPGGKVLRANTNEAGTATFKVRPTRSGRAAIRIAECADVERFSVRPARQVQSRRVPRVTG